MKLSTIIPPPTDRVFLVGQTGSGKTTLAECMLKFREFVVVYDTKGRINWTDYKLVRSLKACIDCNAAEDKKIIYRPPLQERDMETELGLQVTNSFFKWIFDRENTTLYVDELAQVANRNYSPLYYRACMQQGRERCIEVWIGTIRTVDI